MAGRPNDTALARGAGVLLTLGALLTAPGHLAADLITAVNGGVFVMAGQVTNASLGLDTSDTYSDANRSISSDYLVSNGANVAVLRLDTTQTINVGANSPAQAFVNNLSFTVGETVDYTLTGQMNFATSGGLWASVEQDVTLFDIGSSQYLFWETDDIAGPLTSGSITLNGVAEGDGTVAIGSLTGTLGPGTYTFYSSLSSFATLPSPDPMVATGFTELRLTSQSTAVPEPSSLALMLVASGVTGGGAAFRRWRRRPAAVT